MRAILKKPRPLYKWQVAPMMDTTSPVVLLTGTPGGGKSHLGLLKGHIICCMYPHAFGLVVRKVRRTITSSSALYLEHNIVPDWKRLGYPHGGHERSYSRFVYPNWSYYAYAGMGDNAEKENLRSIGAEGGVNYIFIEEGTQLLEEDFDELMMRLRSDTTPFRQMMIACNPSYPTHWINVRLIQGGEATVYKSSMLDNPRTTEDYKRNLSKLRGVARARMVEGKWAAAEGLCYSEYEPADNEVDNFPDRSPPKDWERYILIDFGFSNPMVVQLWAKDPDGRLFRYREFYRSKFNIVDLYKIITKLMIDAPLEDFTAIADHDRQEREVLRRDGLVTIAAQKDVDVGLAVANSYMEKAGDGKPRLFLCRDAAVFPEDKELKDQHFPTSTEEELLRYVFGEDNKPVKEHDHGCDLIRYLCMHVANRGYNVW